MAWCLWSRSAFKYMSVCVRHKCLVRLLTSNCSSTGILKGVGAVYSTGKVLIGCVQCAQRRTAAKIIRNYSFLHSSHSLSYKEFIQQVTNILYSSHLLLCLSICRSRASVQYLPHPQRHPALHGWPVYSCQRVLQVPPQYHPQCRNPLCVCR